MSLFQLVYASRAKLRVDKDLLDELERVAQKNNVRDGITGVLLHSHGHFLQLIEGEAAAVGALFGRIATDPRHESVDCICFMPVDERSYPNWSMQVMDLDQCDHESRQAQLRLVMRDALQQHELEERVTTLLRAFEVFILSVAGESQHTPTT